MRGTCSSIIALLIGCVAAVSCSLNPVKPSDLHGTDDIALLDDARFASANARTGVWMPRKFQRAAGEGIYFLDPHDELKIPVLFIHGMYGSPRDFRYLIGHLDRSRFEPWLYYYASGADLSAITERLLNEINTLCTYYRVRSIVIVAHSMGGLIARDLLLRASHMHHTAVPVLVTLSTPWDGLRAAAVGARIWPRAVPAWHDLATGSDYIEALFATSSGTLRHLPDGTEHHFFASVGRRKEGGVDGSDGVVSVASQLRDEAWKDSYRLYRFDETHVGILNSSAVSDSFNRTLASIPRHAR
jgi:pimeloyl-ACP methyl ester carboxylesterase